MSINNNAANKNNLWTNQKFIDLSHNLGQAYCFGLNQTKTSGNNSAWTTDKFINLSRYLSSAYGVDLK